MLPCFSRCDSSPTIVRFPCSWAYSLCAARMRIENALFRFRIVLLLQFDIVREVSDIVRDRGEVERRLISARSDQLGSFS